MLKMNLPDSHTHTLFSPDSEEPVESLCAAAAEKGISHLTITDHCECNEFAKDSYGERIGGSFAAAKAQQGAFGDLKILCGVELAQPMQDPEAARKLLSQGSTEKGNSMLYDEFLAKAGDGNDTDIH